MQYLWLRLSQTLFRSFGLEDLTSRVMLIQTGDYERNSTEFAYHKASQEFMVKSANFFGMEYQIQETNEYPYFKFKDSLIIDSSLVWHLDLRRIKLPKLVALLDYACGSYNPTWRDLLNTPFLVTKSLNDSVFLLRQAGFRPKFFYDYALSLNEVPDACLPWFWSGLPLSKKLIISRSKEIFLSLLMNTPKFELLANCERRLLMLPSSLQIYQYWLKQLETGSEKPDSLPSKLKALGIEEIFVKPHRSWNKPPLDERIIGTFRVTELTSPNEMAIPAELIYFSNPRTKVLSDYSSTLFSIDSSDILHCRPKDQAHNKIVDDGLYRLPLARRYRFDGNFPWVK